jgi:hypothetical protein
VVSQDTPCTILHYHRQAAGVNVDPTPKLVSIFKFSSIVGMFLTLKLTKWSSLPSCRWDQRSGPSPVSLVYLKCIQDSRWFSPTFFVISGRDLFKGDGCDTSGVTVQATMQTQTSVPISNSNLLRFHRTLTNSTCKETSNSHMQVVSSKFILLKVWPRYNFNEFMRFLSIGLNPFKIQTNFKLDLTLEFIIHNP